MMTLHAPTSLVTHLVRTNAERILDAADTIIDPGEWVRLDARDGFMDTLAADELSREAVMLDGFAAEVRLAVVGDGFTMLALYEHASNVPEAPAWFGWVLPDRDLLSALCETFPALRGAPGVRPFDAEELASWALLQDRNAQGSAALMIEVGAGLVQPEGGPVDQLYETIHGLAWHLRIGFDDEHHRAAKEVLRAVGREIRPASEEPAPPVQRGRDLTVMGAVKRSGKGWRRSAAAQAAVPA